MALTDLDIVSYPPVVLAFASLSLVLSTIKQQHLAGRRNTLVNVEELEAIGEISSPAFELHADVSLRGKNCYLEGINS